MKKHLRSAVFVAISALGTLSLNAQSCSEVYITEIYSGEDVSEVGITNAAFEIFNPTASTIDLEDYTLVLTGKNVSDYVVDLTGKTVASDETFVMVDDDSETDLLLKSDMALSNFNIKKYSRVFLKNDGTTIDFFGQDIADTIDADTLDAEEYLNNNQAFLDLNIDLSSLPSISLRRNPLVEEGDLTWNGLYHNWFPYPAVGYVDIGDFKGICSDHAVVGWANKKIQVDENNTSSLSENVNATGVVQNKNVTTFITDRSQGGDSPAATVGQDYDNVASFGPFFTVSGSQSAGVGNTIDDILIEGTESYTLAIGGGQNGTEDPDYKILQIEIKDDESTGINNPKLESNIKVYPTVFSNYLIISNDELTSFENVIIRDITGVSVLELVNMENKKKTSISTQFLSKGNYIMELSGNDVQSVSFRLIKQ
jgi:hypothetical protein